MILVFDLFVMLFLPQRHEDTKFHKAITGYGPLRVPSCLCGDSPFSPASPPKVVSLF
jgi:hypothetical protein